MDELYLVARRVDPAEIVGSCEILTNDLLKLLEHSTFSSSDLLTATQRTEPNSPDVWRIPRGAVAGWSESPRSPPEAPVTGASACRCNLPRAPCRPGAELPPHQSQRPVSVTDESNVSYRSECPSRRLRHNSRCAGRSPCWPGRSRPSTRCTRDWNCTGSCSRRGFRSFRDHRCRHHRCPG